MADIRKINLNGTDYSIVDITAQSTADSAASAANAAQSTADSAASAANAAQSTADSALAEIASMSSVSISYDANSTALVITTEG